MGEVEDLPRNGATSNARRDPKAPRHRTSKGTYVAQNKFKYLGEMEDRSRNGATESSRRRHKQINQWLGERHFVKKYIKHFNSVQ